MARGKLRIYLGAAPGRRQDVRDAQRGSPACRRAAPTSSSGSSRRTAGRTPRSRSATSRSSRGGSSSTGARRSRRWTSTRSSPASRPGRAGRRARAHERARAPGNEKRWQDVEELLDAGIDVISTVNIQHLESLNDVVEAITGIEQRETIPDEVVRRAEQVELVDQTPGGAAPAHGPRQHLRAREGRRRAGQLLPGRQPRRAARARAHVDRRPGRRGARGVPRGARHLRDLGDPRAGRRRDHRRARAATT